MVKILWSIVWKVFEWVTSLLTYLFTCFFTCSSFHHSVTSKTSNQSPRWKTKVFKHLMSEKRNECFHVIEVRDEKQTFLSHQSLRWKMNDFTLSKSQMENKSFYNINVKDETSWWSQVEFRAWLKSFWVSH